jgi:hypothetical protein
MIEAERLLLDKALDDPANQRFVLLSDRLILVKSPLFFCRKLKLIGTGEFNHLINILTLFSRVGLNSYK